MNKEFIPYDLALELKELGFDEPCMSSRDMNNGEGLIQLPLYQQAFRWFREKHNILATIYSNASGYLFEWHDAVGGKHRGWSKYEGPNNGFVWDVYEEAELACLKKLIEIIKNERRIHNN